MPHIDLLELPYFYGIELDELVELIDQMTPRRVKAGEWLVRTGEPIFLNIATRGRIGIHRRSDDQGRAPIVYERKAPTLFGEIELFCGVTSIADVQALTDVEAFELTRATFEELFAQRHPAMLPDAVQGQPDLFVNSVHAVRFAFPREMRSARSIRTCSRG